MPENVYERIHSTLSWKRIIGFNLVLFLILIIPISVRLAQEDTENRSGAAGELEIPVVTPPPNYPSAPPRIERVSMFFGKAGDTIVLFGANFGDYQWGSKVMVGSAEAGEEMIVRWSNTVLEIKIPETAKTGRVTVNINGREALWDGNLLLYDAARAGQVGISRISGNDMRVFATNAQGTTRGVIELGYISEPLTINPSPNILITQQAQSADSLGKKMKVVFDVSLPFASSQTALFNLSYPGIGAVEIVRAEFYDGAGNLIPLYSDPLSVKIQQQN